MYAAQERRCGSKHLQFMSGIRSMIFWTTALAFDWCTYMFSMLLVLIGMSLVPHPGWTTLYSLSITFIVLLSFGWAMLPLTYWASLCCRRVVGGTVFMIIVYLLGGIGVQLVLNWYESKATAPYDEEMREIRNVLQYVWLMFPHFALCRAINNVGEMGLWCESKCKETERCSYRVRDKHTIASTIFVYVFI